MKLTTLIIGLTFTSICFAQTNYLPQRTAFTLNLTVDDSNLYTADIKATDYVLPDNSIQVYPGEIIYAEFELVNNEIKSVKTVKENLHPEKTVVIVFTQQKLGKNPTGMMLNIQNPFEKKLTYKAGMFLVKYNKWEPTDVSPIAPKQIGYETWPDVIVSLVLKGWVFE